MTFLNKCLNVFFLVSLGSAIAQDAPSPIVQVEQGQVQGIIRQTPEGRQFCTYLGIPFGKAPTGPLRFKAPVPADPWSGVLQVTSDSPFCIQPSAGTTIGTEDCLQLSVYTPQLPTNTTNPSLTVHVYIHGGAYVVGNIDYDKYNPERFMNTDMVVVTLSYRLGVLGFLSTDDAAASGNWALLDQNLALKWVQKNIAAFGGNPNDVVLSGQSVGSVSTLFQYLSPMSTGLFHRVIAQSGSPLIPWAIQEDPRYYSTAMGEHFNCTTSDTTLLIDCLRQVKAEDIVLQELAIMGSNATMVFVPNVETSPSGQFLTTDPLTLFETGNFNRLPLQLGFDRDEGCFIYPMIYPLFDIINDTTFDVIIPNLLYSLTDYRTNLLDVSYAIKDKYYSGVDLSNHTATNIVTINWISDIFMKSGITKTAILVSSYNVPTYFYAYNYVSSQSDTNFTGEPDVNHGNELQYLWYENITDAKDAEFGNRFFQHWVNFILNGKPTESVGADDPWQPTPPGQYNYYDINEQFTMRGNYDTDHMDFWWNTVPAIVNA